MKTIVCLVILLISCSLLTGILLAKDTNLAFTKEISKDRTLTFPQEWFEGDWVIGKIYQLQRTDTEAYLVEVNK